MIRWGLVPAGPGKGLGYACSAPLGVAQAQPCQCLRGALVRNVPPQTLPRLPSHCVPPWTSGYGELARWGLSPVPYPPTPDSPSVGVVSKGACRGPRRLWGPLPWFSGLVLKGLPVALPASSLSHHDSTSPSCL